MNKTDSDISIIAEHGSIENKNAEAGEVQRKRLTEKSIAIAAKPMRTNSIT